MRKHGPISQREWNFKSLYKTFDQIFLWLYKKSQVVYDRNIRIDLYEGGGIYGREKKNKPADS